MANNKIEKKIILEELLMIKDWKHPFNLGEDTAVSLERKELGSWNKWRAVVSAKSLGLVMDTKNVSILDLACNDGYFSFELADIAKRVVGLDGRAEHVRRAHLLKKYFGYDNFMFKEADLRTYNLTEEGEFDLVLCYGILYHLTDPFAFLKRIFAVTKSTLSLSTFLNADERPTLVLYKEDVSMPGSGLDPISTRPSYQAVVRLLYGVGFDLVLRYVPYKLNQYNHSEWGQFFGIKLDKRKVEEYIEKHQVRKVYDRYKKEDQLILCEDIYDDYVSKRLGMPPKFRNRSFFRDIIRHMKNKV
jgi:SAM-dependent methyltransferase